MAERALLAAFLAGESIDAAFDESRLRGGVPQLSSQVAAVLGMAGELGLAVLLVLGLGGRLSALGLFVVNFVAVISLTKSPRRPFSSNCFEIRCG